MVHVLLYILIGNTEVSLTKTQNGLQRKWRAPPEKKGRLSFVDIRYDGMLDPGPGPLSEKKTIGRVGVDESLQDGFK